MSKLEAENVRVRGAWDTNARFWDERMADGNDFFNALVWPGDDAETQQSGVRDDVPRRGRRVASDVHLDFHKAIGKAGGDGVEQVEDAGDSRESLR